MIKLQQLGSAALKHQFARTEKRVVKEVVHIVY